MFQRSFVAFTNPAASFSFVDWNSRLHRNSFGGDSLMKINAQVFGLFFLFPPFRVEDGRELHDSRKIRYYSTTTTSANLPQNYDFNPSERRIECDSMESQCLMRYVWKYFWSFLYLSSLLSRLTRFIRDYSRFPVEKSHHTQQVHTYWSDRFNRTQFASDKSHFKGKFGKRTQMWEPSMLSVRKNEGKPTPIYRRLNVEHDFQTAFHEWIISARSAATMKRRWIRDMETGKIICLTGRLEHTTAMWLSRERTVLWWKFSEFTTTKLFTSAYLKVWKHHVFHAVLFATFLFPSHHFITF